MNVHSPSSCGNDECAKTISSFDDATLIQLKIGFKVSPRPRRVPAVVCSRSKRVHMRARSGVRQGVQKRVWGI